MTTIEPLRPKHMPPQRHPRGTIAAGLLKQLYVNNGRVPLEVLTTRHDKITSEEKKITREEKENEETSGERSQQKRKRLLLFVFLLAVPFFIGIALLATNTFAQTVPAPLAGGIVISQVLYNPAGTETGGEAVEISNNGNSATNISGWWIATESSFTDATIPQGTFLASGGKYLVADMGWSTAKDNQSWRDADIEEAFTLANTDAGVALYTATGQFVDAIGWGSAASIGERLFEGTPAEGVTEGHALARLQDTNNNAIDVAEAVPDFRIPNAQIINDTNNTSENIIIVINVTPTLIPTPTMSIINAATENGTVIIMPAAGEETPLAILLSNVNGTVIVNIKGVDGETVAEKTIDANGNATATIMLPYPSPPGTYRIVAQLNETVIAEHSFVLKELKKAVVDTHMLASLEARQGEEVHIVGDDDPQTDGSPTITNVGNVPITVEAVMSGLQNGGVTLAATAMKVAFATSVSGGQGTLAQATLMPGQSLPLSITFAVPPNALPGRYEGSVAVRMG